VPDYRRTDPSLDCGHHRKTRARRQPRWKRPESGGGRRGYDDWSMGLGPSEGAPAERMGKRRGSGTQEGRAAAQVASEGAQDERRGDASGFVQGRRHSKIRDYARSGGSGRASAELHLPSPGEGEQGGFRAKGVDVIRHTSARGTGNGELPSWERPDVLLGMEGAKRLEGYLRAGWCEDRVTQGGLPRRDRTASACLEEKLASSKAKAAVGGVSKRIRVQPRQAARVLRHQTYADDTTLRSQGAARPNQLGAGERGPERKEKERWTNVQRIRAGAEGTRTGLKVMFDINTPHTLILHAAAARAALAPAGREKWVMSPDSGEMDESSCRYLVPLVGWQGDVHLIRARGVDYTIYAKERRVPTTAAAVFTEMEGKASRAHQAAGMVDLIVGQDNSKWHPRKVYDSWQVEDNLTLMRSQFPPRYIVRGTTRTKRRV
jgi:hypothetical protein